MGKKTITDEHKKLAQRLKTQEWLRRHLANMTPEQLTEYRLLKRIAHQKYYQEHKERIMKMSAAYRNGTRQRPYFKPVINRFRFCSQCAMPIDPTWQDDTVCHRHINE